MPINYRSKTASFTTINSTRFGQLHKYINELNIRSICFVCSSTGHYRR